MEEWKEQTLSLDKITIDSNLQLRIQLTEDRIAEFVEILKTLPRSKIVKDRNTFYLADGFHRYFAHQRSHEKEMDCFVKEGKYKDAVLIAVKENSKSSLPLSREDKKRAIERMLSFFPERANTWIAEDVGSSMQTVDGIRKKMEEEGKIQHRDNFLRRDEKPTPRKYQTTSESLEMRSISRSVVSSPSKSPIQMSSLRELGLLSKKEVEPSLSKLDVKEDIADKILCSLEIIISEDIELKTDMYKLIFSRVGNSLDIRLFSGYGEKISPTNVGIRKSYKELAEKIKGSLG